MSFVFTDKRDLNSYKKSELIDIILKCAEKEDTLYHWHYLSDNPKDLPTREDSYLIAVISRVNTVEKLVRYWYGSQKQFNWPQMSGTIFAWKEIEPTRIEENVKKAL